jgi:predicted  nucleic acid-binding Zn-ribbon protein
MHDSLKALQELQRIDTELIFLREGRRVRPLELESDRRKLEEKKRVVDVVGQEIKKLKLECDRRELDLKKNEADITKLQIALNQAKSNQEYQILKDQIARLNEQNSKIEEEVLKKLGEVEGLDRAKKDAEGDLKVVQGEYKEKEKELQEIVQGLDQQLADLTARRDAAAKDVPSDHLLLYERVLTRHRDSALARIENQVCQGCFMSIPPQTINQILLGRELSQCKNCLRILYME